MTEKTVDELWEMIDEFQNDLAYYKTRCENLEEVIKVHIREMRNSLWELEYVEKNK